MLPYQEVAVLDRNAEHLGIPTPLLMEQAGHAVAELAVTNWDLDEKTVCCFCAKGNNGGDGFVAARYLLQDRRCRCRLNLILTADPDQIHTDLARRNFERLAQFASGELSGDGADDEERLRVVTAPSVEEVDALLDDAELVLDAMLGVGLKGRLRSPVDGYVRAINRSGVPVLAVDAPTGLGTPEMTHPALTATFHDTKIGMDESSCGEIAVVDIGIPESASCYIGPGELVYYPRSSPDAYKGKNGKLLVIGGGPYTGAPALAGLAALRTGVDLVFIATPARAFSTIASFSPSFIVHALGEGDEIERGDESEGGWTAPRAHFIASDTDRLAEYAEGVDAVVLGPGIGRHAATIEMVHALLPRLLARDIPVVVDADGLYALSVDPYPDALLDRIERGDEGRETTQEHAAGYEPPLSMVLTPHAQEFARINGDDGALDASMSMRERCDAAQRLAKRLGVTIILKSRIDIVTDGVRLKRNRTGNPGMTVGGTGDVLAGVVGALLAKRVAPYNAARIATWLNGTAGDRVFETRGYGMLPTDIIDQLPSVLQSEL